MTRSCHRPSRTAFLKTRFQKYEDDNEKTRRNDVLSEKINQGTDEPTSEEANGRR